MVLVVFLVLDLVVVAMVPLLLLIGLVLMWLSSCFYHMAAVVLRVYVSFPNYCQEHVVLLPVLVVVWD